MTTNRIENAPMTELAEQKIRDRLKEEADIMGQALASMSSDSDKVKGEIEANREILKQMEILRDGLAEEIGRLTIRIRELRDEMNELGPTLNELGKKKGEINLADVRIDQQKKEESELQKKVLELTEMVSRRQADLDEVAHLILGKRAELKNVEDEVNRDKKAKREEIAIVVQEFETLKSKINGETILLEKLTSRKDDMQSELNSLLGKLENVKAEYEPLLARSEAIKKETDEYKNKIGSDLASQQLALEQREGDVSLKEKWLGEKEVELKRIKGEVEKHLGRQINSVKL